MSEAVENQEGTEAAAPAVEMITLKEICEELGIKPANARQRLRAKMTKSTAGGFRWEWPVEQKDEIVAFLKKPAESAAEAPAEAAEAAEA